MEVSKCPDSDSYRHFKKHGFVAYCDSNINVSDVEKHFDELNEFATLFSIEQINTHYERCFCRGSSYSNFGYNVIINSNIDTFLWMNYDSYSFTIGNIHKPVIIDGKCTFPIDKIVDYINEYFPGSMKTQNKVAAKIVGIDSTDVEGSLE